MQAMPDPKDPDAISHNSKYNPGYFQPMRQKPVIKNENKELIYDDGTYFLKETHHNGQPLQLEKNAILAQGKQHKI
jgi:hypothetical protein